MTYVAPEGRKSWKVAIDEIDRRGSEVDFIVVGERFPIIELQHEVVQLAMNKLSPQGRLVSVQKNWDPKKLPILMEHFTAHSNANDRIMRLKGGRIHVIVLSNYQPRQQLASVDKEIIVPRGRKVTYVAPEGRKSWKVAIDEIDRRGSEVDFIVVGERCPIIELQNEVVQLAKKKLSPQGLLVSVQKNWDPKKLPILMEHFTAHSNDRIMRLNDHAGVYAEVREFLKTAKLIKYFSRFIEEEISDMETLRALGVPELKDLGLKIGAQVKFANALKNEKR